MTLSCIAATSFVLAQEESFDTKNEVGINLAPVIIPLFTGEFQVSKLELSYVRNVKSHLSLRAKLSILRVPYGGVTDPDLYSYAFRTDTIYSNSSETETKRYYQKEVNNCRLYLSAEYLQPLGKVDLYIGAGFVNGIIKNHSFRYRSTLQTGTPYGTAVFDGDDYFSSYMIGLSPYIGFKVPIAKKMYLNFQTGIEFDYHFRDLRPYGETEYLKTKRFEAIVWPVLTEFGFYYRF